jgi:hypothetical protein
MVFLEDLRKLFSVRAIRVEEQFGGATDLFDKMTHATGFRWDFGEEQRLHHLRG